MHGLDASAVLQGLLSHTRRPLNCVLSLITEILINMEFGECHKAELFKVAFFSYYKEITVPKHRLKSRALLKVH